MGADLYQNLKSLSAAKRKEVEKLAPRPKNLQGYFLPKTISGMPRKDLFKQGVRMVSRIGVGCIVVSAEKIGWEKFINTLHKTQGPGVEAAAKAMRKQYGVTGDTLLDARIISVAGAAGCGFERHQTIEFSGTHFEGYGDWCGMVQAADEMGLGDKLELMSVWCDTYDNSEVHATNKDLWYVHANCLGRGDKYCRYFVDLFPEKQQGSFFEILKRHIEEKREELRKSYPEPSSAQGLGPLRVIEDVSEEVVYKEAVRIWNHICTATILAAAELLGWGEFLNLVSEKLKRGFTEAAGALKRDFDIIGYSLRDACRMYTGVSSACGFDKHHIIEYSDRRIEGVADWCPIIDSAKNLGAGKIVEEMSLWCDLYNNFNIHAVSPTSQQVFTHCLGRGDQYCRFIMEKKQN